MPTGSTGAHAPRLSLPLVPQSQTQKGSLLSAQLHRLDEKQNSIHPPRFGPSNPRGTDRVSSLPPTHSAMGSVEHRSFPLEDKTVETNQWPLYKVRLTRSSLCHSPNPGRTNEQPSLALRTRVPAVLVPTPQFPTRSASHSPSPTPNSLKASNATALAACWPQRCIANAVVMVSPCIRCFAPCWSGHS